ncbi:hypothetical protein ACVWVY_003343 [Bradyrhizobium sp. URHC0002]
MSPLAIHSAVIARLDRAIQYAAASPPSARPLEYWIPAFAGMTAVAVSRSAMPTN